VPAKLLRGADIAEAVHRAEGGTRNFDPSGVAPAQRNAEIASSSSPFLAAVLLG
jgi:hypothetical protein